MNRIRVSGTVVALTVVLGILGLGGSMIYLLISNDQRMATFLVLPPKTGGQVDTTGQVLADSLITRMMHVPNLRIVARETAFRVAHHQDPRESAIDAQTVGVLSGKVSDLGSRLCVDWQLMDARDGKIRAEYKTCAEGSGDGALGRLLEQQPEFALRVLRDIRADLDPAVEKRVRQPLSNNAIAWRDYEKGLDQPFTEAVGTVQGALVFDSRFPWPYVAVAHRQMDVGEALPDGAGDLQGATYLIDKVLTFSPDFGPAWAARGRLMALTYNFDEAKKAFNKALELAPGYHLSHQWMGIYYMLPMDQVKLAAGIEKRAIDLNRMSPDTLVASALPFLATQQYDLARKALDAALKIDPNFAVARRWRERLPLYEALLPPPEPYIRLSEPKKTEVTKQEAQQRASATLEALRESPRSTALRYVSDFATAGKTEDALYVLEQGVERKDPSLIWINSDPGLAALRKHPAFLRLRSRLGLDPKR